MKVIKRDGREVPFDNTRIRNAIGAANAEVAESDRLSETMVGFIVDSIERQCEALGRAASVEEIQDMVEDELLAANRPRLMRHYSDYRLRRELVRKANTTDGRILALIERNNEEARQENANKNPIINSTQRDYIAGEVSRDLTRRLLLPEDVVKAHDEGIMAQASPGGERESHHVGDGGNREYRSVCYRASQLAVSVTIKKHPKTQQVGEYLHEGEGVY